MSSGPRPPTPRIEIHDARIPEWRRLAEAQGMPLARWVREAAEERARREKRKTRHR